MSDYERIEKAIHYLLEHHTDQPSLEQVAKQVHLSPFHFQRLFKNWAGVSPKKFLQFISIEHAKILLNKQSSLLETSLSTGLSGTSRLHDLFVSIEAMTPGEYKNGGENLSIQYSEHPSLFGPILVASTNKGVCHLGFTQAQKNSKALLQEMFPRAQIRLAIHPYHTTAITALGNADPQAIKLHLKGTAFQLKVWNALLRIPPGQVEAYCDVAKRIRKPTAHRAVASAIANNPVAYLIPCHRVIRSSGFFGEYRWGTTRKIALHGWESAQNCAHSS